MLKLVSFLPRKLKYACEHEPVKCKLRIGGFALFMGVISSFQQAYFDNLVYRSGQFQDAAIAGTEAFMDYMDQRSWKKEAWMLKHVTDVLNNKPLKELKQIQENWKTTKVENKGLTEWYSPNGDPYDNKGYFTQQTKFYDDYQNHYNQFWKDSAARDPIASDEIEYEQWEEMHTDIIWFDTAACWKSPFIGDINKVTITPKANFLATDPSKPVINVTPAPTANPSLNG